MRRLHAIALLILLAVPAGAGDIVPLIPGLQWVYEDPAGNTQTVTTLGWTDFAGVSCMRFHVVMTGPHPQVYDQYRSRGPAGEIYYHGAGSEQGDWIYDPPALEYEPPLEVGQSWSTLVSVGGNTLLLAFQVMAHITVFVPYGTFEAFQIGFQSNGEWYPGQIVVPGIGEVERGPFELVAFGPVAPVAPRSWSEVKALFR